MKMRQANRMQGRSELKLAVFSVLEIRGADLDKEQDGKDHVNHRENHVVYDGLHLRLRCIPGALDGAGNVAAANAVTLNMVMTITQIARERIIRRDFFFMCIILLILF